MTEDQDEEAVTAGEFHELADTNLANALLAQGVDSADPSAGQRQLSLSQYALLSIATSLREIAKLQSELADAIGQLAGHRKEDGGHALRADVVRRRRKEGG